MRKVALFGNPNTGKSSLFNRLTGLNQKVGNFPGVTIDKSIGKLRHSNVDIEIIDLPGTYSIYPRSNDEKVVYDILSNANSQGLSGVSRCCFGRNQPRTKSITGYSGI